MMYARYIQPRPVPKVVKWNRKTYEFPYNEWKLVPNIKLYRFLRDCVGTFEVTDFDTAPFERIKDEIEFIKRGNESLIITTSKKAIQVLGELPFIKALGVRNKTIHYFRIINQWSPAYAQMIQHEVKGIRPIKIGIYRTLGGWGDVQMILVIAAKLKDIYPGCHLTFSCPEGLLELAGRKEGDGWRPTYPFIDALMTLGKFNKAEFDIVANLTSPCIRYEVKKGKEVDKNRIQIFADYCQVGEVEKITQYIGLEADEEAWAKKFIKKHKLEKETVVGVLPRSYDPMRCWEGFKETVTQLENNGLKCLIFDYEPDIGWDAPGIPVMGYTIRQVLALLKQCRLVIGPDTGPLHSAAIMGIPTVWLFGNIDGAIRTKGYDNVTIIQHPEACNAGGQPCWYKKSCNVGINPACMVAISSTEVIDTVHLVLGKERPQLECEVTGIEFPLLDRTHIVSLLNNLSIGVLKHKISKAPQLYHGVRVHGLLGDCVKSTTVLRVLLEEDKDSKFIYLVSYPDKNRSGVIKDLFADLIEKGTVEALFINEYKQIGAASYAQQKFFEDLGICHHHDLYYSNNSYHSQKTGAAYLGFDNLPKNDKKIALFRYSGFHGHIPLRHIPEAKWAIIEKTLLDLGLEVHLYGYDDVMGVTPGVIDHRKEFTALGTLKHASDSRICISTTTFFPLYLHHFIPCIVLADPIDIDVLQSKWRSNDQYMPVNTQTFSFMNDIFGYVKKELRANTTAKKRVVIKG
jgi:ADP-heptose:LPS heptosyltransferase